MKKLYLGNAAELRHRTKVIENIEVLKLMHNMDEISDSPRSDIMIVAEDTTPVPTPDFKPVDVKSPIKTTDDSGASEGQGYESNLVNLTKVVFCATEPSDTDVLWAKPIGDNRYQFYAFYNGMWNSVGEGGSNAVINISNISGKVSAFTNDAGYVKESEVQRLLKNKQDTIPDLGEIRANASAGANAADSVEEIWRAIASITPGSSRNDGLLELSTTDGTTNKALLNAALAQGDVKLKKGHYPLDPYVIVNNVVLDLNGACLQSTEERVSKPLVLMIGDNSVIRNGELCGNYNTPYTGIAAKGTTPGPGEVASFESEKLIGIGHYNYNNILIENMDLHNVWGYALGDWGPNWDGHYSYYSMKNNEYLGRFWKLTQNPTVSGDIGLIEVLTNDGRISPSINQSSLLNTIYNNNESNLFTFNQNARTFVSYEIAIPDDCKYVCITFADGYGVPYAYENYNSFFFYDSNGNEIKAVNANGTRITSNVTEMPRVMVEIPEGAVYAVARINFKKYVEAEIPKVRIMFCKYRCNMVTIKDCCIHNNSSLGMCGISNGTLKILNCRSYEQGRPYSSACSPDAKNLTTGFLDIEDTPTPMLIMDGCTSEREHALVMTNAYKSTITNCHGLISIHGGWTANISNCTGHIRASSPELTTLINVSNCVNYETPQSSINWVGSNNVFRGAVVPNPSKERNFIIERLHAAGGDMSLSGLVVGRFYMPTCRGGKLGIKNIKTSKGSQFIYNFNLWTNSDSNSMGTTEEFVIGDCYGITSTCPFLPNGHTIYDSTFNLTHSYGQTNKTNNSWTGEYNNCIFNLTGGSMFYNNTGSSAVNQFNLKDSGKTLVFRNCTINNGDGTYLFKTLPVNAASKEYTIRFINCTIADQSKLFEVSTAGINVEIISEDTDYDARIKALLARVEALEGN